MLISAFLIKSFLSTPYNKIVYFKEICTHCVVHTTVIQHQKRSGYPKSFSPYFHLICNMATLIIFYLGGGKGSGESRVYPTPNEIRNIMLAAHMRLGDLDSLCTPQWSNIKKIAYSKSFGPGLSFDMQHGYFYDTSFLGVGGPRGGVIVITKFGTSTLLHK